MPNRSDLSSPYFSASDTKLLLETHRREGINTGVLDAGRCPTCEQRIAILDRQLAPPTWSARLTCKCGVREVADLAELH